MFWNGLYKNYTGQNMYTCFFSRFSVVNIYQQSAQPRTTVWIILQTSPFNCVASYLFCMAFSLTEMCP